MFPLIQNQRAEAFSGGSESESRACLELFALREGVTSSYRRNRNRRLIDTIGFSF